MKILLVIPKYNLTNKVDYLYPFPLGLGYISAVLKKEGYDVDCLNLNHYNGTIKELVAKKLDGKKYDFVCTGNTSMWYTVTEKIINTVREHKSHPKFILGGPIITTEPEVVFNLLNPDLGVIGEGEKTIIELLECMEKKKDPKKVNGIIFKDKDGKIIITEKRTPIQNLNSIPWPDMEGLEFEKQLENLPGHGTYTYQGFDNPKPYTMLGSRSCPFQCTFCYHDSNYRQRSIDDIMKEINAAVNKYKINIIIFYDDCFAIDKKRLYEFCDRMKELRKKLPWELKWMCQLTVQNVDKEMLSRIKEAGCDTVSYGFESFSPKVLKGMRKPITPEMISRAFHETMKAKIGIQANFIFGDVTETNETAHQTLDWWKKNCKGQVRLGFIQPYPGSEIYKHCLRKGIIKDKADFIKNKVSLENWYNMTDKMTDKEIRQLKKDVLNAKSKYYVYIRPISIRKMKGAKKSIYELYEIIVRCPFCKKINNYKNCYLEGKYSYDYVFVCRNCHKLFHVVSFLKKIASRYHSQLRSLRDIQLMIVKFLKKKKM